MSDPGMRRHEREVTSPESIQAIIRSATVCRVGLVERGEAYVVPLNFGHEPAPGAVGGRFWFHSATDGRKALLVAAEPRVCVQLDLDLGLVTHPQKACAWTQSYRSVMAWGPARPATSPAEARHGLDVIMVQHADRGGWTYPDRMLDVTLVWCVEVTRMTAKQHLGKAEPA